MEKQIWRKEFERWVIKFWFTTLFIGLPFGVFISKDGIGFNMFCFELEIAFY